MKTIELPNSLGIEDAVEQMLSPELTGEEETEETLEASTEEDAEDQHSEETEDDEETEEEPTESEDDEDDEDDEEDSEEDQEPLYTVKVDGEEIQVPLNELTRGYSGQQYVQKGMREVAETRRQVEEIAQSLGSERQRVAQYIQAFESGNFKPPPQRPDESLRDVDPLRFTMEMVDYDEARQEFEQRMAAVKRVVAQQNHVEQQAFEAYAAEQQAQLQAIEPDFADPAKAAGLLDSMTRVGVDVYGYSKEEIDAVVDYRAKLVLRDAMLWRDLQAKKPGAKKRVSKAVASKGRRKKTTTADARKTKQRTKLKQTGRIEDAVDLMFG